MPDPRAIEVAKRLHLLNMSNVGIVNLLSSYPLDEIERQLDYLPYRPKVKREAAFLVEAIRNNYSPPKDYFYAKTPLAPAEDRPLVHENTEHTSGPSAPDAQGHRAPNPPDSAPGDERLGQGGTICHLAIPPADEALGTQE